MDSDGFVRRECPTCEQEFKWFIHSEGDTDAELVSQYFCPLCGVPSGIDTWWTPAQLEHGYGAAGPALDQAVQDMLASAFKGRKGLKYQPDPSFTLGIPTPEPLAEPDDMVIVEPPCHSNEPLKIPESATNRVHCLVCGEPFAA